jgi:hypothetical protein
MLGMTAVFAALEPDAKAFVEMNPLSQRTKDALAEVKAQGRTLGAIRAHGQGARRVRRVHSSISRR